MSIIQKWEQPQLPTLCLLHRLEFEAGIRDTEGCYEPSVSDHVIALW